MKPISEIRKSISPMSELQDRWADWQQETWVNWRDQKACLDDCGINRDEKTIKAWRKGAVPSVDAWALLLKFGWPLAFALFGESLVETFNLEQEDYARRQSKNEAMFNSILSVLASGASVSGGVNHNNLQRDP